MKTKPFSELQNKMTPEQRAESERRTKLALIHLTLLELQQSLGVTQSDLESKHQDVILPDFSTLENQDDIQVSILSQYVKALGGSLKLVAHFPEKEVVLAQFE